MGELGVDNPEQIDKNMWMPEEEQDKTEVCCEDSDILVLSDM